MQGIQQKHRLHSLDTFRGLTIALMILVNSPGSHAIYPALEHALWNGCTLADLVFPFFLFIVGISCSLSLSTFTSRTKILKRSALIFAVGLLLNAFPNHLHFEQLRLLGVLQRIAICYCAAAFIYLNFDKKTHLILIFSFLLGYWGIMVYFSPETFTADNNVAALIDRTMLGPMHLYRPTFDPEGLLSTLPAIATTLLGNLTGLWLREKTTAKIMALRGGLMIFFGLAWSILCPLNKTIWSSSYVLYTAGIALVIFAFLYWFIDIRKHTSWCIFFDVFGVNALAAYVLHVFFLKVQAMIYMTQSIHEAVPLRPYLTQWCFGHMTPENASLSYALSYLLLWFIVLFPLYRYRIYLKL